MSSSSGFRPMPDRLAGELEERVALKSKALQYHQPFFDDYLRAILPNDLVCIVAPSGLGKTDLSLSIASANARRGVPVHYFALEAEFRELERRTKFSILARMVYASRHPRAHELNYDDWMLGDCEDMCGPLNAAANREFEETLGTLHTFYRGTDFGPNDLTKSILEVARATSLIIVDHLHYIDNDNEDEHRALGETVKQVRDVALHVGKPVILVAQLRKRDTRSKQLFVQSEDILGSKHVFNICTQVLALQPASDLPAPKWYLAPTYLQILKHRRSGAPREIAVAMFDRRTRTYGKVYALGANKFTSWEPLKEAEQPPSWARRHRPWTEDGPMPQERIATAPTDDVPHAASSST